MEWSRLFAVLCSYAKFYMQYLLGDVISRGLGGIFVTQVAFFLIKFGEIVGCVTKGIDSIEFSESVRCFSEFFE